MSVVPRQRIRRLTGALGAVITGLDLRAPLCAKSVREITAALDEHLVCFFPDQSLSPAQLVAFGRCLGSVDTPATARTTDGVPEVMVRDSRQSPLHRIEEWHSDGSYTPDPPAFTVLHAQTVPQIGGDTVWANTQRAWDRLSPALRGLLSGLTAIHDFTGGRFADPQTTRTARHPLGRSWASDRLALYVNPLYTTRICELCPEESQALLDLLFAHLQRPEFGCRYRWSRFDLAIWDNRSTIHRGVGDHQPSTTRIMHRLTIHAPELTQTARESARSALGQDQ